MTIDRAAAVERARADVGMVARPGVEREAFERRIRAPGYGTRSTCALWAGRSYLVDVLSEPWAPLVERYRDGHAMSDIVDAARHAKAIRWRRPGQWPQPGDVVLDGSNGTACAHVWVVSSLQIAGDVARVEGVEGGQIVDGYQAVTYRWRSLTASGDRLYDVVHGATLRPILEWYDLQALADCYGSALS